MTVTAPSAEIGWYERDPRNTHNKHAQKGPPAHISETKKGPGQPICHTYRTNPTTSTRRSNTENPKGTHGPANSHSVNSARTSKTTRIAGRGVLVEDPARDPDFGGWGTPSGGGCGVPCFKNSRGVLVCEWVVQAHASPCVSSLALFHARCSAGRGIGDRDAARGRRDAGG